MSEPKVNTIFHGNCLPEITHQSEGGYLLKIPQVFKDKERIHEMTQVEMKAFGMIVQDALNHQDVIDTHTREENDGRTEES